jgi:hypothetical protein
MDVQYQVLTHAVAVQKQSAKVSLCQIQPWCTHALSPSLPLSLPLSLSLSPSLPIIYLSIFLSIFLSV